MSGRQAQQQFLFHEICCLLMEFQPTVGVDCDVPGIVWKGELDGLPKQPSPDAVAVVAIWPLLNKKQATRRRTCRSGPVHVFHALWIQRPRDRVEAIGPPDAFWHGKAIGPRDRTFNCRWNGLQRASPPYAQGAFAVTRSVRQAPSVSASSRRC